MFARLGHLAVRRKMLVVISSAILIALAAGIGSLVFARLSSAGYGDPKRSTPTCTTSLAPKTRALS
jgi:hypothetical protein